VHFFDRSHGGNPAIPYEQVAELLFTDDPSGTQKLVPFLGAGASLGQRSRAENPTPPRVAADKVDAIIEMLNLSGTAARFVELAAQLAIRIQALQGQSEERPFNQNAFQAACAAKYPPSAGELAAALAFRSKYNGFERPLRRMQPLLTISEDELTALVKFVADSTEIGSSAPSLLASASYYQYTTPEQLLEDLGHIFRSKTTSTRTHWLVAQAALKHLAGKYKHYLVITTNYDSLMERALERVQLPYCVLTVTSPDEPVDARFSSNVQRYLELKDDARYQSLVKTRSYPRDFVLELRRPLVILFKLHGHLSPSDNNHNGIVISDEDYIRYLMQMREGGAMIPAMVSGYLNSPAFLFLGYSFSDWNVRAIYKSVITRRFKGSKLDEKIRDSVRDWAVVHEISDYESKWSRESINLIITDLRSFVRKVRGAAIADHLMEGRVDQRMSVFNG